MNKQEAIKAIQETATAQGVLIENYSAAPVGYATQIDSLYIDFSERNRAEYMKMYNVEYNRTRGGWDKFTADENMAHAAEIVEQITARGFEVDSIDFFNESAGVIFLNVTKPDAQSIEDYYTE